MEAMMAKNQGNEATTENATTEAAAAGGDKRAIVLPNGEKRADYIRRRWAEKASRSDITKELNSPELYVGPEGGSVKYQIVFQATRGVAGGPDPKTETAPAEGAEAAQV
jgi:hypothetical protein